MPNVLDLRRRIRSVKNTQQITRAMKMVAAARLRRAQERVVNARPYAAQMLSVLGRVAARVASGEQPDEPLHPLLAERPAKRILLVLITADRGLCGAFNTNLIRAAQSYLARHQSEEVSLIAVGRKGRDFFRKHQVTLRGDYVNLFNRLEFSQAQEIAGQIIKLYTTESIDAVDFIYRYSSGHSDAIVTENYTTGMRFLREVDTAVCYVNASTQFTDGAQFGLGAEIIDATQKFHARGPVGLREICTYKWIVFGDGQVRA